MGIGYLVVETRTNNESLPVGGAHIQVETINGTMIYELTTDSSGKTETVSLEAPDKQLSLDPNYPGDPYSIYRVEVQAPGFENTIISGVHIFDEEVAIQPVTMIPMLESEEEPIDMEIIIGEHAVQMDILRDQEGPLINPLVLRHVIIPDVITVHLGTPTSYAQNVVVSFPNYIKNVASSEIYATWPEQALRANIHAITTFALNRIFTEWYRSRGYSFDITSSPAYDQYFVYGRTIYESISRIVDEIFNQYVSIIGRYTPFFTSFCNGTTVTCAGLSQWGTVSLANSGMNALQILRYYYSYNIEIVESNIFTGIIESYPGTLRLGDTGLNVRVLQTWLGRIRRNYPAIPVITDESGIFGASTQAAVRAFQSVFNLTPDGIVGRATWYKISHIFSAVTRLGELDSEEIATGIGTVHPSVILRRGSQGFDVITLQYILSFIGEFYPNIPRVIQNGIFGESTYQAVVAFQRMMGLTPDGIVGAGTWRALYDTYWGIRENGTGTGPQPETFEHIVQPGDTLFLLAQRFGTTVDTLRSLNGLTSDVLNVGQVLLIPRTGTTPPPTQTPSFNYTVRSGDTLFILAQRFGTTADAIRSLNNLTSNALSIGQVLKIPGNVISHTVQSGDTLFLLAQRFGTTVDVIRRFNALTSDALSLGQILLIPR